MKRFVKRIATAGLAAVMAVTGGVAAFAEEPSYLPLRLVMEGVGAEVGWADGRITVYRDGANWVFTPNAPTAQVNGMEVPLSAPVVIVDGMSLINMPDAIPLFGDFGQFPITIATAVLTALGAMAEADVPALTVAFVDSETG